MFNYLRICIVIAQEVPVSQSKIFRIIIKKINEYNLSILSNLLLTAGQIIAPRIDRPYFRTHH